jgi:hypothetical protein
VTAENTLSHIETLERNNDLSQNQGHILCHANVRPQKHLKNTLLYIQLAEALFQDEKEYISKVAKTEKEVCKLVEAGFEYVTDLKEAKIFRKRKL